MGGVKWAGSSGQGQPKGGRLTLALGQCWMVSTAQRRIVLFPGLPHFQSSVDIDNKTRMEADHRQRKKEW